MTVKNSSILALKLLILIFHSGLLFQANAQCCLEFTENSCIRCPAGMHLYRSNCIYDLEGCLEYASGFDCSSCKSNYQLVAGTCSHTRFSASISNGSNFAVFLQSTLKPDDVMQAVQEAIEADEQLWIDWYNFTLISNKTYMNKNGLTRNTLTLMNLTVGNPKLQYIFTSVLERPTAQILLYRFTYELSSIGGFVDCLLAVEMVNNTQNYLELNLVKQNTLSAQEKWSEVKEGDACERYILKQILQIFPQTANQSFVKGYWANVTDGVNFTMFFMSSNEGIVSYVYTAEASEMPVCNANKDANNSTASTQQNQKDKAKVTEIDTNNKNDTTAQSNPTPIPTPTLTPKTNTSDSKQNTKAKNADNSNQNFVSIQNLESNPIYLIGYAVIAQKYEISSYVVNALFYIETSPILYGLYLSNNVTYIRFTFRINSTQGEFEIASYSQAARPFIDVNPQTATNASYANTAHNSTSNDSAAAKPNPITANTTLLPANCGKVSSQFIDITSSQSKDIFLPRINLLLTAMFQYLANSRIKSVKYNLGYQPSSLSKITYQIFYENMEGETYDFQVAIINNQFQLVKSPNSTSTTPANSASSTVEAKPNAAQSQGTAAVKNVASNENVSQNAQAVSPVNTSLANKTNTATTLDSHKDAKTPYAPIAANQTQAATSKTKLNNTFPIITEISPKNYTSEPKYKSLITILKSLYHIPPNATVVSMKTWEDVSVSSKYEVIFKMAYPMPLKDGSIAKVSTYQLTVNPSSFVSVQSEKIDYIKAPPPPQPSEKPSFSLSLSLSPYLKIIFNAFTTHSPKLASFVLQSLHLSAGDRTYGNSVTPYNEKIQFSKGKEAICFDVSYQLIMFDSPESKGQIFNLLEYKLANCSNVSFDSLYSLSSAKFVNQTNISQTINKHMQVFSNGQVTIDAYQSYQQLCRVRFTSINTGEREVVIDSQSLTVLAYRTSPRTLFTPHLRNTTFIDPNVVRTLQAEMQKIYKLAPGSILLQLIRKTNDDSQIWLIDVFGKTQIKSIWEQGIFQNLKMQALYYPQQSFLKIANATVLDLSYNTFLLESRAANWVEVPIESTFSQPKFPHIIASLKATYSSFLDNSFLVNFYREPNNQYSTLGQYIAQKEGARFQMLVSKQFTNNYHINYLLTVRYGAISNTTELQNLQSIENSNITIKNCQIHDNSSTMPKCSQCQEAYVLVDNICLPEVPGCEEYFFKLCSKCRQGYFSQKDMGKCLSLEDSKEDLIVNSLIVLAPIPQQ